MDNPWTDVLDYACVWASGATDEATAVALITEGAYNNFGKEYDDGITHTSGNSCNLTTLLADSEIDCKDMSAVVELFTRILGGSSVQVLRINGPFVYNPILPVGGGEWIIGSWSHHQVGWYGGKVYDACIQLDIFSPYVPVSDDLTGNYKTNLIYSEAGWSSLETNSVTSFE